MAEGQAELVNWPERRARLTEIGAGLTDVAHDLLTCEGEHLRRLLVHASPRSTPPPGETEPGGQEHFADAWQVRYDLTAGGGSADIGNTAPHAVYVLYPTPEHVIRPKSPSGVLRWVSGNGAVHYARSVTHPGTKGNDVPGKIWSDYLAEVPERLAAAGARAEAVIASVFR